MPDPALPPLRPWSLTTGNIYFGLRYPIGIALMTLIIGTLFLKEIRDVKIH